MTWQDGEKTRATLWLVYCYCAILALTVIVLGPGVLRVDNLDRAWELTFTMRAHRQCSYDS